MEKDDEGLLYLAEVHNALADEAVSEIDFDRLRTCLGELGAILPTLYGYREEAALFREDLKSRIAGMLKAVAIAERGKSSLDEAMSAIDHLSEKSAAELIGLYRRTQARFRDTFPAGFGMITPRRAPGQIEKTKHRRS